jgi:hypothetical protein
MATWARPGAEIAVCLVDSTNKQTDLEFFCTTKIAVFGKGPDD